MNRSKLRSCLVLATAFGAAACGGRAAPGPSPAAPAPEGVYGQIWQILNAEQLSPDRLDSLRVLEARHGPAIDAYLGVVAKDTLAPPLARGQALIRLGDRGVGTQMDAFRAAMRSDEMRVRAGAVVGLRGIIEKRREPAVRLLEIALRDPDPWVQAKALETLGTADIDVLRRYLARDPDSHLRGIAEQLIQVAEERGHPLADTGAVLARTAANGVTLAFHPRQEWPQWDAAVGRLVLAPRGGQPVVLADDVEVVGDVVPAFFSPDGDRLVYEAGRRIVVRDMATGEERVVGEGIAPRILPFTSDFVFLRHVASQPDREGAAVNYDVVRAPFAAGEPSRVGAIEVRTSMQRHGGYSPARWMRVVEEGGSFYLAGDEGVIFSLPSPFSQIESSRR